MGGKAKIIIELSICIKGRICIQPGSLSQELSRQSSNLEYSETAEPEVINIYEVSAPEGLTRRQEEGDAWCW